MVYLVGGYKLARHQVLKWCEAHNIYPPRSNIMVFVNRWLISHSVPTRLLACDYDGECIFLVVTHRKVDLTGTPAEFEPFLENEHSRKIKKQLEMDDVEFVTVANPYGK
jgi:hypothetical protein